MQRENEKCEFNIGDKVKTTPGCLKAINKQAKGVVCSIDGGLISFKDKKYGKISFDHAWLEHDNEADRKTSESARSLTINQIEKELKDGDIIKVTMEGTVCDGGNKSYIFFKLKSGKELGVQKDWLKQGVKIEPLPVGRLGVLHNHAVIHEFKINEKVRTTPECLERTGHQAKGVVCGMEGVVICFKDRNGTRHRYNHDWLEHDTDQEENEFEVGCKVRTTSHCLTEARGTVCGMQNGLVGFKDKKWGVMWLHPVWIERDVDQDTTPTMGLLLKNSADTLNHEETFEEWSEKKTLRKEMGKLKKRLLSQENKEWYA